MKVGIKKLEVPNFTIGNNGVEFDVSDSSGHVGDLYVARGKLVWCKGKRGRSNGVDLSWTDLMAIAEHKDEVLKYIKRLEK